MSNDIPPPVSLFELLVKTSYLTQTTDPEDRSCDNPLAFGSGFIVTNGQDLFFVTADHNVHLDDYTTNDEGERTWKDYVVSIYNNYTPPDQFLSTVLTPLGSFYYMEQLHLHDPGKAPVPVDIAVCKMQPRHFQYPFLTDEVNFVTGETIAAGELKRSLRPEDFAEPATGKAYFIYGKVRADIVDGIRFKAEPTLKEDLHFVSRYGDYLLFHTPEEIADSSDWEGLSGSPVISEEGDCVGVLCSVLPNSRSLWVKPMSYVKMLMGIIVQEERLLPAAGKELPGNDQPDNIKIS